MSADKKEIAGAVIGVLASVAGYRFVSRTAIGLSFPGTAVAVTGLALASVCDSDDPAMHCKAGRLINLPGGFAGRGAVKLIDSGIGAVKQFQAGKQQLAGQANYGRLTPPRRRR